MHLETYQTPKHYTDIHIHKQDCTTSESYSTMTVVVHQESARTCMCQRSTLLDHVTFQQKSIQI